MRKSDAVIYGYARCSTTETKQDVKRQERELKAMGATEIYMEYESGTKINRAELNKVLNHVKQGDTIVVTEVSRITRSTRQLCDIIDLAKSKCIKLVFGSFVVDFSNKSVDSATQAMVKMMGVFAEMERNITIERIRSGIAYARAKGIRLGRPRTTIKDIPKKVLYFFSKYKNGELSKADYARICNISRPTLYKYLAIITDN